VHISRPTSGFGSLVQAYRNLTAGFGSHPVGHRIEHGGYAQATRPVDDRSTAPNTRNLFQREIERELNPTRRGASNATPRPCAP